MVRPTDVCKMCLETKVLESSHLIPSALYDYCRGHGGLDPIAVTSDVALSSSRQVQDYLLCKDCEDVLNKGGESWLASKLATYKKAFPLYDLVTSGPPLFDENDCKVYCSVQNPLIDADKIAHFAMGIFWKASVHSWRGGEGEPMINLGPYSDKVRLYLKGEAGFPANMALAAVLSPPAVAYIGFNNPYEAMRDSYRNFMFVVPGVWFNLSVGKMVTSEAQSLCIGSHVLRPIMISAKIAAKGQERAYKVFNQARKTESFRKAMEKVRLAKAQGEEA
jgi:hypothetical protein